MDGLRQPHPMARTRLVGHQIRSIKNTVGTCGASRCMRRTASHENDIIRTGAHHRARACLREPSEHVGEFTLDVAAVAHRVLRLDREADMGFLSKAVVSRRSRVSSSVRSGLSGSSKSCQER